MESNYQERIDAYIRNEMSGKERIAFENDLKSDARLADEYYMTLRIVEGLSSRQEKKRMIDEWQDDIEMEEEEDSVFNRISNFLNGRKFLSGTDVTSLDMELMPEPNFIGKKQTGRKKIMWVAGVGIAVCIAICAILIWPPGSDLVSPESGGQSAIFRGNAGYERIDELINLQKYDMAMAVIDSLEAEYKSTYDSLAIPADDGLTEEEAYMKQRAKLGLYEISWRKINVLIALDRVAEAKALLEYFRQTEGCYKAEADSLWYRLE